MSTIALRKRVKKAVDALSEDKLLTVADFVGYVAGAARDREMDKLLKIARMQERLARAHREFEQGKGTNWRKLRRHV